MEPDSNITFEYHSDLEPVVWNNAELNPEIHKKLLEIAQAFIDYLDIELEIEDVTLTGSLANYNYTKYSDFDLHIIIDMSEYKSPELLKKYCKAKSTIWNSFRDIKIKGYDVEIYVQSLSEPHYSTGVYSLKNNEWVAEPRQINTREDVDIEQVKQKKQSMLDIINYALSSECDVECAEKAKEKFMSLRKAGLEQGGEFSPENLAFKELRRTGDIERLIQGIVSKKDKSLSLDSLQREDLNNFKNFLSVGVGDKKRGPRHQSFTAGMNKLGRAEPGKNISMVAQMHKRKLKDSVPVHNLKKKASGKFVISDIVANQIVTRYNLNLNKIMSGEPRMLSTSGQEISYDPHTKKFFLTKY